MPAQRVPASGAAEQPKATPASKRAAPAKGTGVVAGQAAGAAKQAASAGAAAGRKAAPAKRAAASKGAAAEEAAPGTRAEAAEGTPARRASSKRPAASKEAGAGGQQKASPASKRAAKTATGGGATESADVPKRAASAGAAAGRKAAPAKRAAAAKGAAAAEAAASGKRVTTAKGASARDAAASGTAAKRATPAAASGTAARKSTAPKRATAKQTGETAAAAKRAAASGTTEGGKPAAGRKVASGTAAKASRQRAAVPTPGEQASAPTDTTGSAGTAGRSTAAKRSTGAAAAGKRSSGAAKKAGPAARTRRASAPPPAEAPSAETPRDPELVAEIVTAAGVRQLEERPAPTSEPDAAQVVAEPGTVPAEPAEPPGAVNAGSAAGAAGPGHDAVEASGPMPDPTSVPRVWLSSYPPGVPETYSYPSVPLTRFLDDAARDFPQATALEFLGATTTYRQLHDSVERFATALQGLGVGKGDRVGIVLPNCPQHVVAVFAALRLGAVVAENNPLYTEPELVHQLVDAGVTAVVFLDSLWPTLRGVRPQVPSATAWIGTGIQEALPFAKARLFPLRGRRDGTYYKIPSSEGVLRFSELVAKSPAAVQQAPLDPLTDLAMLLYTGGTTGVSKGVMLTHHNLVANAFQARLWVPDIQAGRENVLCVMPFFHSYGLTTCLMLGMLSAATLTLLPRFDLAMVLKTIDRQKPTLFPGVPTMYVAINEAADVGKYDLRSIRACISGASPLPVEVGRRFEELTGGKLREGYGLTETSPVTHANPIYGKAKSGAIGLPIPDTIAALVDLDDPSRQVGAGEMGELAVFGPQVMHGYWQRPEETAQVLRSGWLLTGDIAEIDEEGYFSIVDRKSDVIIAGGFNVYPRDVEQVLSGHPKVERAVAAGVPDAYRGETVKAYVVLRKGQTTTVDELDAFCRERLAAYKVPTAYELRDSLPENVIGKVLRRVLVEEERARLSADA